ncbi:hypothetical protein YC2023_110611 [Brassica napus]
MFGDAWFLVVVTHVFYTYQSHVNRKLEQKKKGRSTSGPVCVSLVEPQHVRSDGAQIWKKIHTKLEASFSNFVVRRLENL